MLGIFLDIETNGLNTKIHRILEIAYKIIDLCSGQEKDFYQTIIFQPKDIWRKSNLKSLEINKFSFEEIQKGKKETIVSNEIINSFKQNNILYENAVFICQNPSFDRAFFSQLVDSDIQNLFNWPYHWLDLASMHWALAIKNPKNNLFPWEIGLKKDLISSFYDLPQEEKPHRALNGVNHLILCYKKIVGFPYN